MSAGRLFTISLYLAFVAFTAFACYRHPAAEDFDRYMYEALVRGRHDTFEVVYPIVKHSNKRAEDSSILDSPIHMGQLEPLYAIKPLYVIAIEAMSFTGLPIQTRINLISALSLFGTGILVLAWTGRPLLSALLLASYTITGIFRVGTPDGFSALVLLAGLFAVVRNKLLIGVLLLVVSVWIRTDTVLFVIVMLGYLLWEKKVTLRDAGVLAGLSASSVAFINHFSGNYGWRVLFQLSFIGGRSPAEVVLPPFSIAQYLGVVVRNAESIVPQVALWALLGIMAWKWSSPYRSLLIPIWLSVAIHFALFPSPESRYLVWAFLVTGVVFICASHPRAHIRIATH